LGQPQVGRAWTTAARLAASPALSLQHRSCGACEAGLKSQLARPCLPALWAPPRDFAVQPCLPGRRCARAHAGRHRCPRCGPVTLRWLWQPLTTTESP